MEKSTVRLECEFAILDFINIINIGSGNLLYVGIAGDKKGGEYSYLFPKFKIFTLDYDKKWRPNISSDITNNCIKTNSMDIIICVQVIEHIPNIFNLSAELYRVLKPNGYIMIDSPWNYKYHAEPPSFGDYWRISKDGFIYLFKNEFNIIKIFQGDNTSCLLQKK